MKIGVVCYPGIGGSGIVATELGKGLAQAGHEVHFITYRQPTRLEDLELSIRYHSVEVSKYPLFEFEPYEQALAGTIVNVAQTEQLDVVHVHYAVPHITAAITARETLKHEGVQIPFVATLHGTDVTVVGKEPYLSRVMAYGIDQIDAVTVVSDSLREDVYRYFDVQRQDIETIPNFVDLKRFKAKKTTTLRQQLAPKGEFIVSHASNFRPVKRLLDLIRAFAVIQQKVPSKLVLVGDGPLRSEAELLVEQLGLQASVHFLGIIKKPQKVFVESDVFLLPSEAESFGLAALEAMACGAVVLSSNAGGLPELVEHGVTGYTSEVGDYLSMANQAIGLLQDSKALKTMKKASQQRAKQFSMQAIVPEYEALYRSLLKVDNTTELAETMDDGKPNLTVIEGGESHLA